MKKFLALMGIVAVAIVSSFTQRIYGQAVELKAISFIPKNNPMMAMPTESVEPGGNGDHDSVPPLVLWLPRLMA